MGRTARNARGTRNQAGAARGVVCQRRFAEVASEPQTSILALHSRGGPRPVVTMKSMNRRSFLQTALAAGTLGSFYLRAADKAGRKHRVALVGAGWWGGNIVGEAMASGQCEIVGVCDVDQRALNPTVEKITKLSGDQPRKYRDY